MALDSKPIRKSIRKIRKFLKKTPQDPAPEKVHDLRTSTRWLEAAIQAFGLDAKSGEKSLLRDLRRVRKKAGKVRDMDVLTERALTIDATHDEQNCLVELLEHVGMNRGKRAKKLHATGRKVGFRLRRELKRGWADLEPVFEANRGARSAATKSRAQAAAKEAQLTANLRAPLRLNRSNLHPYRLKVKELRYILQLEDRRNQKQFVKRLGAVKDAIGEWHDWEELIALAGEVLAHGSQCRLLRTMRSMSAAKYKRALEITKDMRKTYVDVPSSAPPVKAPAKLADVPAPVTMAV